LIYQTGTCLISFHQPKVEAGGRLICCVILHITTLISPWAWKGLK